MSMTSRLHHITKYLQNLNLLNRQKNCHDQLPELSPPHASWYDSTRSKSRFKQFPRKFFVEKKYRTRASSLWERSTPEKILRHQWTTPSLSTTPCDSLLEVQDQSLSSFLGFDDDLLQRACQRSQKRRRITTQWRLSKASILNPPIEEGRHRRPFARRKRRLHKRISPCCLSGY